MRWKQWMRATTPVATDPTTHGGDAGERSARITRDVSYCNLPSIFSSICSCTYSPSIFRASLLQPLGTTRDVHLGLGAVGAIQEGAVADATKIGFALQGSTIDSSSL